MRACAYSRYFNAPFIRLVLLSGLKAASIQYEYKLICCRKTRSCYCNLIGTITALTTNEKPAILPDHLYHCKSPRNYLSIAMEHIWRCTTFPYGSTSSLLWFNVEFMQRCIRRTLTTESCIQTLQVMIGSPEDLTADTDAVIINGW